MSFDYNQKEEWLKNEKKIRRWAWFSILGVLGFVIWVILMVFKIIWNKKEESYES